MSGWGKEERRQSNVSACSRAKRKNVVTLGLSSHVNLVLKYGTYRSPLNTSYAWDISHALATLYHPYAHEPVALTEYLKHKLRVQHAKRQSHSHPAHVKQNVPLERNNKPLDAAVFACLTTCFYTLASSQCRL